jgi:hypothetical protein
MSFLQGGTLMRGEPIAIRPPRRLPIRGSGALDRGADVENQCKTAASRTSASVHRVHGWLRILYRISGAHYEEVRRHLRAWTLGRVPPPSPPQRLLKAVADPAQRVLPFPEVRR